VINGNPDGSNRISSASISLNGVQIVGPSDFNRRVAQIVQPVQLGDNNQLTITLASAPGSLLTIEVECAVSNVTLSAGPAGVSSPNASTLLSAVPIVNTGTADAQNVVTTTISLNGGTLTFPAFLPVTIGAIPADHSAVLDADFSGSFAPQGVYGLAVQGTYTVGSSTYCFAVTTSLTVPPAAPGSAVISSNTITTQSTAGPYAALPQPPQTDENDAGPPTPIGPFQILFPPTPNGSQVQNAGGVGAAVGFVFNTQSNGVNVNFPPDPSAASSGASSTVVVATGNLYVKYSTDGGSTFTTVSNLSTVFGDQPDGGYCCDQVVHYIPTIDRMVWLIQTNQSKDSKGNVTGPNSLRVAWAKPADIAANFNTAWTWCDVSSTFLGLGNDWLDFPDLSTANGHLYLSVDDTAKSGLVVARISYADMQKPPGNSVTWEFTDPTKSTAAKGAHLTQNASNTMYWAGHNSTTSLRIFSWAEDSGQYNWRDVGNSTYSKSDYTSKAQDNQYWLDPRLADSIIGAVVVPFAGLVSPGSTPPSPKLVFAWNAARDTTFAQPYIRLSYIDSENFTLASELEVWNAGFAFAYPALAEDPTTGEVAISLMWGGGSNYANHAVGFLGDFVVYITTSSNVTFTVNPANVQPKGACDAAGSTDPTRCTRSGDYLSLRHVGTSTGLFGTLGYEVNLVDSTKSTDCAVAPGCVQNVRWVEFGRPGSVNPPPPPR
jgi:hypothetical protein